MAVRLTLSSAFCTEPNLVAVSTQSGSTGTGWSAGVDGRPAGGHWNADLTVVVGVEAGVQAADHGP